MVSDIVKRIYCELMQAADQYPELQKDDVAATLILTVDGVDGIGAPSANMRVTPSLTLAVTGNLQNDRTNQFQEKISYPIWALYPAYQKKLVTIDCKADRPDIVDQLNIAQTVGAAHNSVNDLGFDLPATATTASAGIYTSKTIFVVTRSLSPFSVTWLISAIGSPDTLKFSSVYTDSMQLDFAPHVVPSNKPMDVYIKGSDIPIGNYTPPAKPSTISGAGGNGTHGPEVLPFNPDLDEQMKNFSLSTGNSGAATQ